MRVYGPESLWILHHITICVPVCVDGIFSEIQVQHGNSQQVQISVHGRQPAWDQDLRC